MTVRKVITRSKKTFRVKFPSLKNNCMVYCESILESHCALLFEISPHVKTYIAQPSIENYYCELGLSHKYFPDFKVVFEDDSELDVEVKPKSKLLRLAVNKKLEAIAKRYKETGRRFRILTEEAIQPEPFHSNLKKLKYHRKLKKGSDQYKKYKYLLETKIFSTVAQAGQILGGENFVFDFIASGFLATEWNKALGSTSKVWIRSITSGDENDPFRI